MSLIQTQATRIKSEILLALNGGIKDKQLLYNLVVQKTGAPRPTVRRVASQLKKELEKYHAILAATSHNTNVATDYDCPTCNAKRVIKKYQNRCPNCQQYLDWSDVE